MLTINLLAVGNKMPRWVGDGFLEYAKRIHGRCELRLIEIPAERRDKQADIAKVAAREAEKIKRAIPNNTRVIALDRGGDALNTLALSQRMDDWMRDGEAVALVIGGAEGLSPEFLAAADEVWSLSQFTFAHPLTRVIVAEQIYRAYTLLEGIPYHR